ncbi:MAG TPA: right-handed parallel beta-helix repeat-containing protein [Opitutaceae bacterium]|nr:right-handed parallel beta-helix repeat-containing protein [Opitutaceae bacterium]
MKLSSLLTVGLALAAMPLVALAQSLAIDSKNAPGSTKALFRISKPGSYHLTGNITGVAGKAGIEIASSNVSLDLRGFTLQGNAQSLEGIRIPVSLNLENVTVSNGAITQWGKDGLGLINMEGDESCVVETTVISNIQSSRNLGAGIRVTGGSVVRDCTAVFNGGAGVVAGENSTIERVTAAGNAWEGIWLASGVARGCTSRENNANGFTLTGSGLIVDSTASGNKKAGFESFFSGVISHCNAETNSGWGFLVGTSGRIENSNARRNLLGGIRAVSGYATILSNTIGFNLGQAATGILSYGGHNRIEGNHVTALGVGIHLAGNSGNSVILDNVTVGCDLGLKVDSSVNFIARNIARNNQNKNFEIVSGNRAGSIVVPPASGAITNVGTGQSKGIGSTDPWANISF